MIFEGVGFSLITGVALGAQYVEDELADKYKLYSYVVIELLIFNIVLEFSKPVG
jgi:hypothetical protein